MPPQRKCGGSERVIPPEVRTLQRQVQALQEDIYRGMNITVGNESEEENEEEGNIV